MGHTRILCQHLRNGHTAQTFFLQAMQDQINRFDTQRALPARQIMPIVEQDDISGLDPGKHAVGDPLRPIHAGVIAAQ